MPVNLSRPTATYKYAPAPALAAAVRRVHPGSRDPHQGVTHVFFIDRANRVVKAQYGFARGSYWVSAQAVDTSRPVPKASLSWLKAARADEVVVEDRDFCRPPPARYPAANRDYGGPSAAPRTLAIAMARQHDVEFNSNDYCAPPPQRYGQQEGRK